jgi:hypothetical protein
VAIAQKVQSATKRFDYIGDTIFGGVSSGIQIGIEGREQNYRGAGLQPRESFKSGVRRTVEWYLADRSRWERIRAKGYRGERLGVLA